MNRVYTADNVAMAWHVRNVLQQYGITATVINDKLYSIAGEIPVNECLPEVWVEKKLDVRRAEQIIKKLEAPVEGGDWACGKCGELNTGAFDLCWNCQYADVSTD